MNNKFLFISVLSIVSLVFWIYWSSNVKFKNTALYIKQHRYYTKNISIEPKNTTCERANFIVILVTSYVGHVELRSAHRHAMPNEYLQKFNAVRIFLTAIIPPSERYITQEALLDESNNFGDILQGSFIENYRNLTLKHLMGLAWAATKCQKSSYILKVDDDTVFNLNKTYEFLVNLKVHDRSKFLIGYMLNNTKPKRSSQNKWFVTHEEYARSEYPPYASGWYYITTPKVAASLYEEAICHPYFWIDDIFVSGILTEALNIHIMQLPRNFWLEYYEQLECCLKDMISKFIKCDYVVGPNGGRTNLIYEFNEALRNCDKWGNCTIRKDIEALNKVCVAYRERTIFSDGRAEVQNVIL